MEHNATKRIEYIDALRGLSMILVVYFHIPSYGLGNAYMGYNDVIEWFRMPLFFMISGFVFYKAERIWNMETVRAVLQKKFMVQIVPTAIFLMLFLSVFYTIDPIYFGSDKKGYWFTFVLFEYFVIYSVAEALLNRRSTDRGEMRVMTAILLLSAVSFYYASYYNQYAAELGVWKGILGFFSFVKFKHFIFFWLGTFIRKHLDTFVRLTDSPYCMACLIGCFFAMACFPFLYSICGLEYLAYLLTGAAGAIILFTFFRRHEQHFTKDKWLGRTLQFIGRRTLDIYLLHYFILPYHLQRVGSWLLEYDNKSFDMIVILPLALWVIALSLLLSSIIRLSPLLGHYLFGAKRAE